MASGTALDFDPDLPDLPAALDPAQVASRFQAWWPVSGGAARVSVGKVHDVKYQPSRRCVAAYDLVVESAGQDIVRTIGVIDVTPDGVALRLYIDDPNLPWLRSAATPGDIRVRVARMPEWEGVLDVVITPIRYKPEARCVFRFEARTRTETAAWFGKVLAEGADQLMATLVALDATARQLEGPLRISPPFAYWPDLHLVVQAAVPGGIEFHAIVFDEADPPSARLARMVQAGAALASLHMMTGVPGPPRSFEDDVSELETYLPAVERASRWIGPGYGRAIRLLRSVTPSEEPSGVASHGAFRTDQFLIDGHHLFMVDLDTFCWANPGRDVGNFLAYLAWRAIRRPEQQGFIDRAGRSFLQGYSNVRTLPDDRWNTLCTALSLLKIAGRRFRSLTVNEWPAVPGLVDRAYQLISG
jgi:hypothetical protein